MLTLGKPWVDESLFDDCSAIIVGKKASATGEVLFGHNEDDRQQRDDTVPGPRATHEPGELSFEPAAPRYLRCRRLGRTSGQKPGPAGRLLSAIPSSTSGAWRSRATAAVKLGKTGPNLLTEGSGTVWGTSSLSGQRPREKEFG